MGTSNYSDEFKRDAVHQITVRGYPVREVARRLGVSTHSGGGRLIRTSLSLPAIARTYAEQSSRHSARAASRLSLKFWRE
jgi:transposase-like protein